MCGSARDASLLHTWYQGIRACKTRPSQTLVRQQLDASQRKVTASLVDIDVGVNSKAVSVAAQIFAYGWVNTSTPAAGAKQMTVSANMPTITLVRAHDTGATSSKAVNATNTTIIRTPVNISTPKPTIIADNLSIFLSNRTFPAHLPSHSSAGVAITARKYHFLFCLSHVVTLISTSMSLVIVR